MREIAPSFSEDPEPALPSLGRHLGVSYDEGGEGLGDPSQVAQVREVVIAARGRRRRRQNSNTRQDVASLAIERYDSSGENRNLGFGSENLNK